VAICPDRQRNVVERDRPATVFNFFFNFFRSTRPGGLFAVSSLLWLIVAGFDGWLWVVGMPLDSLPDRFAGLGSPERQQSRDLQTQSTDSKEDSKDSNVLAGCLEVGFVMSADRSLNPFDSWLPADGVTWEQLDRPLRDRLTAIAPDRPVALPDSIDQLAQVVAACADRRQPIAPFGSGSKLSWGHPPKGPVLPVGLGRLDRLVMHDAADLVVTVEAGMKLRDLQTALEPSGQWLPIDPAFAEEATLGGIVATADAGSLRQRYGGIRDLLLGISIVRWDGQIAKAGGRVVKNVAGYDLMKLFTGSFGTLGLLATLTFRAYPIPEQIQTVLMWGDRPLLAQAAQGLRSSTLTPIALDWVEGAGFPAIPAGQTGLAVRFGSVAPSVAEQVRRTIALAEQLGLRSTVLADRADQDFWQTGRSHSTATTPDRPLTVKFGALPTAAADLLDRLADFPDRVIQLHASSGLGCASLGAIEGNWLKTSPRLRALRATCEAHQGFLTLLNAPAELTHQLDRWGYRGPALPLMGKIKQQFDPHQLLNPGRFVV
jgi:glycolate oxidase FAD binding subunit